MPSAAPVLMSAQVLPVPVEGDAPDWVHLLPAGSIRTLDGRGPYRVEDADALIALSMEAVRLPIDENHATDLAAPKGHSAPARGWIVALDARDDGLWGQVEWTRAGRELLADRSYRGLSPVIVHDKGGRVLRLLRASLTNTPNLRGLTALHSERDTDMLDLERIAAALGLEATATIDDVVAKIEADQGAPALQSTLTAIGAALGVAADEDLIVLTAGSAKDGADRAVALQSEVMALQAEVSGLKEAAARKASEAYVDGEMAKGRSGLSAHKRDAWVSLHMKDPALAEDTIGRMDIIAGAVKPERKAPEIALDGTIALNAEQSAVAKSLGIDEAAYIKTLLAERALEGGA